MNWPKAVMNKDTGYLFLAISYHLNADCLDNNYLWTLIAIIRENNDIVCLIDYYSFLRNYEILSEL